MNEVIALIDALVIVVVAVLIAAALMRVLALFLRWQRLSRGPVWRWWQGQKR